MQGLQYIVQLAIYSILHSRDLVLLRRLDIQSHVNPCILNLLNFTMLKYRIDAPKISAGSDFFNVPQALTTLIQPRTHAIGREVRHQIFSS